jgi:hypothetical protein
MTSNRDASGCSDMQTTWASPGGRGAKEYTSRNDNNNKNQTKDDSSGRCITAAGTVLGTVTNRAVCSVCVCRC